MDQGKIGKFISTMRKKKGLTQEQLGEKLGVTNKTVSRWETGKYMPDLDKLQELSALLGISINELLAGERIEDADRFIKKADENLVQVLSQGSSFSWQDKVEFFKRKWIKDHKGWITLWVLAWCVLAVVVFYKRCPELVGTLPIVGFAIYGYLRNQMMIYVEGRAFPSEEKLVEKK